MTAKMNNFINERDYDILVVDEKKKKTEKNDNNESRIDLSLSLLVSRIMWPVCSNPQLLATCAH